MKFNEFTEYSLDEVAGTQASVWNRVKQGVKGYLGGNAQARGEFELANKTKNLHNAVKQWMGQTGYNQVTPNDLLNTIQIPQGRFDANIMQQAATKGNVPNMRMPMTDRMLHDVLRAYLQISAIYHQNPANQQQQGGEAPQETPEQGAAPQQPEQGAAPQQPQQPAAPEQAAAPQQPAAPQQAPAAPSIAPAKSSQELLAGLNALWDDNAEWIYEKGVGKDLINWLQTKIKKYHSGPAGAGPTDNKTLKKYGLSEAKRRKMKMDKRKMSSPKKVKESINDQALKEFVQRLDNI